LADLIGDTPSIHAGHTGRWITRLLFGARAVRAARVEDVGRTYRRGMQLSAHVASAVFMMARGRLTQTHPSLTCPTRLESSHLPNLRAIMNDRINRMGPEQYPPSPAWSRNENPPYPRLIGTDYRKSILKVES